ncbi:MAG: metallophosphoesterase [Candidatus Woesearchaeota archaeon]
MKIAAFVDTHGNTKALEKAIDKAKKNNAEILICAGDISIFENDINRLMKKLNTAGLPVLIVPGNHESPKTIKEICKKHKNLNPLHKAFFRVKEYVFMGMEADGFGMEDPDFTKWASKAKKELLRMQKKEKKRFKIILVTHAPPHNTKLDNLMGSNCGNKAVRKFIEENNVLLSISGHIHENAGKMDTIKKTKVMNPGPYGRIVSV